MLLGIALGRAPHVARADAPAGRYTLLSGDTEVKDNKTGLIWARSVEPSDYPWDTANNRCKSKGSGYRLPTIRELQSLVDEATRTFDRTAFPDVTRDGAPYSLWASTLYAPEAGKAWAMGLSGGTFPAATTVTAYGARCVR